MGVTNRYIIRSLTRECEDLYFKLREKVSDGIKLTKLDMLNELVTMLSSLFLNIIDIKKFTDGWIEDNFDLINYK